MAYELGSDERVTDAITRCAHELLQKALGDLREGIHSDPVRAVHAARKAIKKERALLRLGRPALSRAQRRSDNATLREAGRRLSGLRDAEVMLQALDRLSQRFVGQLPESAFAAVRARLEHERATAHERAAQSEAVAEAIQALDRVDREVDGWRFRRQGWSAIEGGLERTYRQGRAARRAARKAPTLENLHEWRKRVKDLWYDARLLSEVSGPVMRGYAEDTEQLSELLGEEHDLGVLTERIAAISPDVPLDLEPMLGLIEHRRDQLRSQAEAVGRRVYAETPGAFVRRMRRSWKAGRRQAMLERAEPAIPRAPSDVRAAPDGLSPVESPPAVTPG